MTLLAPTPERDVPLISLALKTLGSFDFSKHNLLEFVREILMIYLDDDNSYDKYTVVECVLLICN